MAQQAGHPAPRWRKFTDKHLQRVYDGFRNDPPTKFYGTTGAAYQWGFEHPEEGRPGTLVAKYRNSEAYAAWAAGVDNARAALAKAEGRS